MNKKNRKLLNEAVESLKYISCNTINSEDIIVAGSIALDLQGLLPNCRKDAHDIDLIIKMDAFTWVFFKAIVDVQSQTDKMCKKLSYNDGIIIKLNDNYLNIWRNNGNETATLKDSETGVFVKSAGDVIDKKKSYHRIKDYQDINLICNKILS